MASQERLNDAVLVITVYDPLNVKEVTRCISRHSASMNDTSFASSSSFLNILFSCLGWTRSCI